MGAKSEPEPNTRARASARTKSQHLPVAPASDPVQPAPRREKLPNTGDASSVAVVVAAAGTVLTAFGLRKKMQK